MATIFQRLNKVFGSGVSGATSANYTRRVNNYSGLGANDVIFATNSKEEYTHKLAQLKQQRLLAKQWKRAQYEVSNNALTNQTEVQMMYREADMMDLFPEIGAALDIYMEEGTYVKPNAQMINVASKSERIKSVLEDLLYNRLSANTVVPMIMRSTVKYGNTFMLLNVTEGNGIVGWKQLPVYEIMRFENGMDNPYSAGFTTLQNIDVDKEDSTKFVWYGKNEYIPYRNWQIAHFRLLYDSLYLPYGVSALNKARRHWRMLSIMEDMMLMYRLERSVERRVFKVNVGAIDEEDVPAYMDQVANEFKRTPIIDPLTGQLDLRRNVMSQMDDFFIPVRDPSEPNPIETLAAGQNMTAMDDIKFVQNKLCTALRVPKSFLNFEETTGDGKNLSMLDVRFTRTVNRVQQMILMELNKVCIIHLYLLGFEDELTNFTLSMNNPSSQAELMEIDNMSKKIEMAKSAVADPGGGLPIMSVTRACKEILGWSDEQIADNLEELRLEKALAAELEGTAQIIKKTGLFDKVDNLYGDIEAMNNQNSGAGGGGDQEGDGGAGGGMPGAPGDMGGGDDTGGDMGGADGSMDMGDAAAMEGGGDTNGGDTLAESFMDRLLAKTLNDKKAVLGEHMAKVKHYQDLLAERRKKDKYTKDDQVSVPLLDKAFFVNEELDSITKGLQTKISSEKTTIND